MLDFVAPKQTRLGHLMHFGSSVHLVRILLKCGMFHLIQIRIKYTLPLTPTSHIILKAGIHSPERSLQMRNGAWIPNERIQIKLLV